MEPTGPFITYNVRRARPVPFVAAIYAIIEAMAGFIDNVALNTKRPWGERESARQRLNRVFQEILGLTALINTRKVGAAFFAPLRPKPQPSPDATPGANSSGNPDATQGCTPGTATNPPPAQLPAQLPARTPRPPRPRRPRRISARAAAIRLAMLLREFNLLAREIGEAIPKHLQRLCNRAARLAGCHTLPPDTRPIPMVMTPQGLKPRPRRKIRI